MATVEELYFVSLERDVKQLDNELAHLEQAMERPGGGRDRAVVASRIEAAARRLRKQLDEQSGTFWLLFQEPGRESQARFMQERIERMFDRILSLLSPQEPNLGDDSLAEKVQRIQELKKEFAGYKTVQHPPLPDAAYWKTGPGRGLEADPWSSLVLLSAILFDVVHVMLRRPKD